MTPTNEQIEVIKQRMEVNKLNIRSGHYVEEHSAELDALSAFLSLLASHAELQAKVRFIEESLSHPEEDTIEDVRRDLSKEISMNVFLSGECDRFHSEIETLQAKLDAAELKWTKDRPTVEGYYWYRSPEPKWGTIPCKLFTRNGVLCVELFGLRVYIPAELQGEFAGPIQPPASRGSDDV
jgi:hypothetical protein